MARPDPRIPRASLRIGILTCCSTASLRLGETDAFLQQGLLTQAGVLFSFALEEFGKAVLLRKAYESGADPVLIPGFYDHEAKLAAAASEIPPEHLLIDQIGFGEGPFGVGRFDGGVMADLSTRLSGLYVDWKNGEWVHGRRVNPDVLSESSKGAQRVITQRIIDWT